jgi:tetratricopeptide (TPR) repeat protein
LFRPQASRFLGATYLLAGQIEDGVALVQAAADEVESKKLLMQQAVVLALRGEASLFAGRADDAANAAQRALVLAQERGQRGDAAAALYVLAEAGAHGAFDIGKAEQYYLAAIALTAELGMLPLLARSHLGIGRLYVRAGGRDPAEDHLLTATRQFIEMDMPLWLRHATASLAALGHVLVVSRDHRSLYEYLRRILGAGDPIRVVIDAPGDRPRIADETRRQHLEGMLHSHGLCITGSD